MSIEGPWGSRFLASPSLSTASTEPPRISAMADSDDLASILPSGDEKQMLKALESEFKQAKKSDSLERLRQLLPAAEQLEAGRQHARAASRIRYAITQNIARLERAQGGEELVRSVVSADDVAETEPVLRAAADGFTARGRNGQLTVYPTKIVISREGAMGFISQGHKRKSTSRRSALFNSKTQARSQSAISSFHSSAAVRRSMESGMQSPTKTQFCSRRRPKARSERRSA
jgi:hypothetical protein